MGGGANIERGAGVLLYRSNTNGKDARRDNVKLVGSLGGCPGGVGLRRG